MVVGVRPGEEVQAGHPGLVERGHVGGLIRIGLDDQVEARRDVGLLEQPWPRRARTSGLDREAVVLHPPHHIEVEVRRDRAGFHGRRGDERAGPDQPELLARPEREQHVPARGAPRRAPRLPPERPPPPTRCRRRRGGRLVPLRRSRACCRDRPGPGDRSERRSQPTASQTPSAMPGTPAGTPARCAPSGARERPWSQSSASNPGWRSRRRAGWRSRARFARLRASSARPGTSRPRRRGSRSPRRCLNRRSPCRTSSERFRPRSATAGR